MRGLKGALYVAVLGGALMLEGCRSPAFNKDVREEYRAVGQLVHYIISKDRQ